MRTKITSKNGRVEIELIPQSTEERVFMDAFGINTPEQKSFNYCIHKDFHEISGALVLKKRARITPVNLKLMGFKSDIIEKPNGGFVNQYIKRIKYNDLSKSKYWKSEKLEEEDYDEGRIPSVLNYCKIIIMEDGVYAAKIEKFDGSDDEKIQISKTIQFIDELETFLRSSMK